MEDLSRLSYRLHRCGSGGGLDTSRGAVLVEGRSLQTSREPIAGVMDRRRSGQSSDSDSWSLHTAGL